MSDAGIKAIDRIFDGIDSAADIATRIFNRTKRVKDEHGRRGLNDGDEDTTSERAPVSAATGAPQGQRALAVRRFKIVEATDAQTGVDLFIVTDGNARCECPSREFAERVLRALEVSP